jgi:hypothetical protein
MLVLGLAVSSTAGPFCAVSAPAAAVKMKRFTIDVPQDLHARVKITCAQRGLNMADELRRILEREFPADVVKS